MHILELILEGFKSYPVRTHISGWDPSFNAITGLNGSGKSNILDAICFVLGLTKTDVMRAQNQQDLIYKRGQAGITKASVTVVFDNSDSSKSPEGYQHLATITVTRQIVLPNGNKYIINGHKAPQNVVQRLFQSIQLNINNPNFLIMQGKITKVLNMKPQEILGMVEEAAGTRTYEERKDSAKKTMAKKDKDVENLTNLLETEITPKLDKLRKDKREYLAYQKATRELEGTARQLHAMEWTHFHKLVESTQAKAAENAQALSLAEKEMAKTEREIEVLSAEIEKLKKQRDKEAKRGGKAVELQENISNLNKDKAGLQAKAEGQEKEIKSEEKTIRALEDEQKLHEKAMEEKQRLVERLAKALSSTKEKHEAAQSSLDSNEELLQTLLTGVTAKANSNNGGGYLGQLADAQERLVQAQTQEEQTRNKLGMQGKELKAAQARFKDVEKEVGLDAKKLDAKKADLDNMRRSLAGGKWSLEQEQGLEQGLQQAKETIRKHQQDYEGHRSRLPQLDFNYTDPGGSFQASKVKGMVAQLITLAPEHHDKSTALEIAAGGKLYNVVVKDSETGKQLLKGGRMRKRYTMIPLDQIQGRILNPQKRRLIEDIAPGNAWPAVLVVGYSQEVTKAMEYVFGDTIICRNAETAKKLAFDPNIRVRCVTLEGDVYDPSGTLSGGAAPQSSGILIKAQELVAAQNRMLEAQAKLRQLQEQEHRMASVRDQWKGNARGVEMKEHEIHLLEGQVANSNASRIRAQVEELEKTVSALQEELSAAQEKQKSASADIKRLEKDMSEFKNNKEGKTEELRATIQKQKSALQKAAVDLKVAQKDSQTAVLERDSVGDDIASARKKVDSAQKSLERLRVKLRETQEELQRLDVEIAEAQAKLKQEQAALARFDTELEELDQTKQKHKEKIAEIEVKKQQLGHDAQALKAEIKGHHKAIKVLEERNTWIREEHHLFGQKGSLYEFKESLDALRERDAQLRATTTKQAKKVNTKVMSQLENDETKEADIKRKLAIVLNDKRMIESTIADLDRMKRDTLTKTWDKVTVDFGDIFAELLPGNTSKLEPPEGKDIMDGLEIKVRLGSVWKQSLTELSGGQRSLIALSLIMALLQYSPAPVYILDEIDAALDLSHTQNIGTLFRTRFKGAQFIVVSLKEGLFTNANVLFKTRFRDGTSIVERTADRTGGGGGRNGAR